MAALCLSVRPPSPATAQTVKLSAPLAELEARARQDSNDAAAHYYVGLAYWGGERYDESERALRQSAALDARLAEAYLALAYLPYARRPELWEEEQQGHVPDSLKAKLEESDRMYRRAFLVDPLVDLRITAAALPGRGPYWTFDEEGRELYDLVFKGFDELNSGHYAEAYDRLDHLISAVYGRRRMDKVPAFVLWHRGLAAAHIGKNQEAIGDFQMLFDRSLKQEKRDSLLRVPLRTNEYRYMLAVLKERAGARDEAVRLYRESLENDLGLYMAHVRLAEIFEREQNLPDALAERERAVSANPDDETLLVDQAVTQIKARRLEDAERTLRQATAMNPRDARVYYILGVVTTARGEAEAARQAFTTFVNLAPSRLAAQVADAKRRLEALH